jgi:hypothetical protein
MNPDVPTLATNGERRKDGHLLSYSTSLFMIAPGYFSVMTVSAATGS